MLVESSLECRDLRAQTTDEPTPSDRRRDPARGPHAGAGRPPAPRSGSRAAHGFVPHQLIVKFAGLRAAADRRRCRRGSACARRRRRCGDNPAVDYAAPELHRHRLGDGGRTAARSPTIPARSAARPGRPAAGSRSSGTSCPGRGPARRCYRSPPAASTPSAPGKTWKRRAPGRRRASRSPCSTPGSPTAPRATRFRRSPDFTAGQFVKGHDFVDGDRPAARRKRPRHPRRRHDRREDQQRHRPHRPRLPGEADAGAGARRASAAGGPTTSPRGSASPSTTAPT